MTETHQGSQAVGEVRHQPVRHLAQHRHRPGGSDTGGLQSYDAHYADTRKWVSEGWLDYIVPQLYWNIGFAVADYAKLLPWWADVVAAPACSSTSARRCTR